MTVMILSLVVMLVVIAGMSIGVLLGNKPVQGSCGGLNNIDGMGKCDLCGGSPASCKEKSGE
jgi:hypothetical protein